MNFEIVKFEFFARALNRRIVLLKELPKDAGRFGDTTIDLRIRLKGWLSMEEDRNASRSALFKVRNGTSSGNPGGRKMKLPFSPRHVFLREN